MTDPNTCMRTLLIDDDPFALKLLARQLAQLGRVAVTLCEHAKEAIDLLQQSADSVGLVFCDLQMPDIDGVEFVRYLARIGYRGDLVLVSGEDVRILQTVERLAQAHGIRLLGALSKPVSPEQLKQVLARNESRRAACRAERTLYQADEIRRALAGTELVNHYQPKVELKTGLLVGVEALVRWQHPQAGLVYPDQFISTAEDNGLIDELTGVVLDMALRQLAQWRGIGIDLKMAVNVSMENLAALDFPDSVARLAADAGIALSGLTLEVTETRLMRDVRASLDIVTRLRLKRIGLSIDDFGTGHSSLAQLRDIPFDELKLDRSFVHGSARDPALRAIVEGTLAMARQLGMKSVAEGVEDSADWDFLRALGCEVAQGYFVSAPMPGGDLPAWLKGWEQRMHDGRVTLG